MGVHDALRRAGRAAGVVQRQQPLLVLDRHPQRRGGVQQRLELVAVAARDHEPHVALDAARHVAPQVGEVGVDEQHARAGVLDDPGQLGGRQPGVQGVEHRPGPGHAEVRLQGEPGVGREHRHPVAGGTPRPASAPASRAHRSASSAYVRRTSPSTSAVRPGLTARARSRNDVGVSGTGPKVDTGGQSPSARSAEPAASQRSYAGCRASGSPAGSTRTAGRGGGCGRRARGRPGGRPPPGPALLGVPHVAPQHLREQGGQPAVGGGTAGHDQLGGGAAERPLQVLDVAPHRERVRLEQRGPHVGRRRVGPQPDQAVRRLGLPRLLRPVRRRRHRDDPAGAGPVVVARRRLPPARRTCPGSRRCPRPPTASGAACVLTQGRRAGRGPGGRWRPSPASTSRRPRPRRRRRARPRPCAASCVSPQPGHDRQGRGQRPAGQQLPHDGAGLDERREQRRARRRTPSSRSAAQRRAATSAIAPAHAYDTSVTCTPDSSATQPVVHEQHPAGRGPPLRLLGGHGEQLGQRELGRRPVPGEVVPAGEHAARTGAPRRSLLSTPGPSTSPAASSRTKPCRRLETVSPR